MKYIYNSFERILFLLLLTSPMGSSGYNDDCHFFKSRGQPAINCNDRKLREVPSELGSSIKVLFLEMNRIKKLKISSFEPYSKLTHIYLHDNMIRFVEPGTFSHLTSLMEIQLGSNSLLTIPLDLFSLPSLINLYVQSNDLLYLQKDLESLQKPIKAPLQYLNLADCGLDVIPNFGLLPELNHLNISLNPLKDATLESLAPMCKLTQIDLYKTEMPICTCHQFGHHISISKIQMFFEFWCGEDESIECPDTKNSTIETETYFQCKAAIQTAKVNLIWKYVVICISAVIFVILCSTGCYYKRKKKREKRKKLINLLHQKKDINNSHENDGSDEQLGDSIVP